MRMLFKVFEGGGLIGLWQKAEIGNCNLIDWRWATSRSRCRIAPKQGLSNEDLWGTTNHCIG